MNSITAIIITCLLALIPILIYRKLRIIENREKHEIELFETELELKSILKEMMSSLEQQYGKCHVDILLHNISDIFYYLLPQNHILFYNDAKIAFIGCKTIPYSNITGFNIVDNPQSQTISTIDSDNRSVIRRAFTGGLLFGEKGAVVGAITAERYSHSTTYTTHNYTLYISTTDISLPTIKVIAGSDTDSVEHLRSMLNIVLNTNFKANVLDRNKREVSV